MLIQYRNHFGMTKKKGRQGMLLPEGWRKRGALLRLHICFRLNSQPPWIWTWCSYQYPSLRENQLFGRWIGVAGSEGLFKQGAQDQSWLFQHLEHLILRQRWAPQAPSLSTWEKRKQPNHLKHANNTGPMVITFSARKSQNTSYTQIAKSFWVPTPLHLQSLSDSEYPLEKRTVSHQKHQNTRDKKNVFLTCIILCYLIPQYYPIKLCSDRNVLHLPCPT